MRMRHKSNRNEDQIEGGNGHRQSLPCPVAVRHQCGIEEDQGAQHRQPRGYSKEAEAGTDGNEFGDQREKIADSEIDHGKPSPEGTEAFEDEFGMAPMGSRAQANSHLLNDNCH